MKIFNFLMIGKLFAEDSELHTDGVLDLEDKNFKNLSEDEQKEMLGKIFSKMDTDGDENIVQAEMVDWAWQIERKYMAAEIKNWLNWYDIDENGLVEYEELVKQQELRPIKHKDAKELELRLFAEADKDKDNKLDADEFEKFQFPRYFKETKPYWIEEVYQSFDTDSDGQVSFNEFLKYAGHDPSEITADVMVKEREYFDEVDEDKNGKLDVSEVGQLIDPRDECIIEALVEQFIDEADADKDKNITFEEMIGNYELLLDSHVTAHGSLRHDEL